MEENVKEYHFAREFRKNNALDEKEKMRAIRENAQRSFIELKIKTQTNRPKGMLSEFEMADEMIEICISRYGENLEKLEYASDSKAKEINRALMHFNEALDQEIRKANGKSDKLREEK